MVRRCAAVVLGVLLAASAWAVDCAGPMPDRCSLLDRAKTIFVGTVTEDKSESYRFRVTEAFKGVKGQYIDLAKIPEDFHFQLGKRYLVFAGPCWWNGASAGCLTYTYCSDTRHLTYAAAILDQLRAEKIGRPVAAVYGTLVSTPEAAEQGWDEYYRSTPFQCPDHAAVRWEVF
jgi:hypothetical protein